MDDGQIESIREWSRDLMAGIIASPKSKSVLGTWVKTVVHRQSPGGEFEIAPEKCVDWHRVA
jgi:hypothetical protein